jgi:hypothetical protein
MYSDLATDHGKTTIYRLYQAVYFIFRLLHNAKMAKMLHDACIMRASFA